MSVVQKRPKEVLSHKVAPQDAATDHRRGALRPWPEPYTLAPAPLSVD